jgi:hypothetical protein
MFELFKIYIPKTWLQLIKVEIFIILSCYEYYDTMMVDDVKWFHRTIKYAQMREFI